MTRYVLDANVFIEAAHRYYAFDLAPGFWQALLENAANGRIQSIDRIKDEIEQGDDELKNWVNSDPGWFASTDQTDIIDAYRRIMSWVQRSGQFSDAAKGEFARGADGWLVAYAMVNGNVVVTHEQFAPDVRKTVPIPNVCREFGVTYVDTFQMLRDLGVRLS